MSRTPLHHSPVAALGPPIEFTASLLTTRRLHLRFFASNSDKLGRFSALGPASHRRRPSRPFAGFIASATATASCRPAASTSLLRLLCDLGLDPVRSVRKPLPGL